MRCPDCGSKWPKVIVAHAEDHGTHFCGECMEWFTVIRQKRSPMLRYVLMAPLLVALGAGSVSVDWQSRSDEIVEWWNAPSAPGTYSYSAGDFYYWRQCSVCYDIFTNQDRDCCKACGSKSINDSVCARLLDSETDPKRADGYQTANGTLYVFKTRYFDWDKFFIGADLYSREEMIIARRVNLR